MMDVLVKIEKLLALTKGKGSGCIVDRKDLTELLRLAKLGAAAEKIVRGKDCTYEVPVGFNAWQEFMRLLMGYS